MNKLYYLISVIFILFSACTEEEHESVFDQSADKRKDQLTQSYIQTLEEAEHGWKAIYYPNNNLYGGFGLIIKLDGTTQKATMYSDYSELPSESTYHCQYQQEPSLVFDSYGLLHRLSDPEIGVIGEGFQGDFEFYFRELSENRIVLQGKLNEGKLILERASSEDVNQISTAFKNSERLTPSGDKPFFAYLALTGVEKTEVSFVYSSESRRVNIAYMGEGENTVITKEFAVEFNNRGFKLSEPLLLENQELSSFFFDEEKNTFILDHQEIQGELIYSDTPAFPFFNAANEFLTNSFFSIEAMSPLLMPNWKKLLEEIPSIEEAQLYINYNNWISALLFRKNDGGYSWAGFTMNPPTTEGEDRISFEPTYELFGEWGMDIYNNEGGAAILEAFFNPEGFFIVPQGNDNYYLVSRTNSLIYFILKTN